MSHSLHVKDLHFKGSKCSICCKAKCFPDALFTVAIPYRSTLYNLHNIVKGVMMTLLMFQLGEGGGGRRIYPGSFLNIY